MALKFRVGGFWPKMAASEKKKVTILRFFEDFDRVNDFKRSKIDLTLNLGNF